jgi:hypothetical protein
MENSKYQDQKLTSFQPPERPVGHYEFYTFNTAKMFLQLPWYGQKGFMS